jgi:hypothetical protein
MGDNTPEVSLPPPDQVMQAAISQLTQLTGLVQGLQAEVARMQTQLPSSSSQPADAPMQGVDGTPPAVPTVVQAVPASADQVTGKLKLPQPKSFSSPEHPGAVENCDDSRL